MNEDLENIIGNRIRECRVLKDLTQLKLSDLTNIHVSSISYYEQGIRKPNIKVLTTIVEVLNISSDYLLGLTDEKHLLKPNELVKEYAKLPAYEAEVVIEYIKYLNAKNTPSQEKGDDRSY